MPGNGSIVTLGPFTYDAPGRAQAHPACSARAVTLNDLVEQL